MKNYWNTFFNSYRLVEIKSDQDLYFQVGKSVGGKPIGDDQFKNLVSEIAEKLDVSMDDTILDLGCGNGVITYELALNCKRILGLDFSKPFIENAKKFKSRENIEYYCNDILQAGQILSDQKLYVNKILLHGVLGYIEPEMFFKILESIKNHLAPKFSILVSSVPDAACKWKFYNTLQRKWDYMFFTKILGRDKGVGRWWKKSEIQEIIDKLGFKVTFLPILKGHSTGHYRMDFVISNKEEI